MGKRAKRIPLAGYVLDGLVLVAAKVNSNDEIVTEAGNVPIAGIPSLLPWFTKRRVENAVRRLHQAGIGLPDLNAVPFSTVAVELNKDPKAKARLTGDQIQHLLLTNIKNPTAQDILDTQAEALAMLQRLEDAVAPAVVTTKAA